MSRTARLLVILSPQAAGAIAASFVPAIGQDQAYHRFADARAWLGIPHAARPGDREPNPERTPN